MQKLSATQLTAASTGAGTSAQLDPFHSKDDPLSPFPMVMQKLVLVQLTP
jgi:hypothetical protein